MICYKFTNSISIISDSIHDISEVSINYSFFYFRKEKENQISLNCKGMIIFTVIGVIINF